MLHRAMFLLITGLLATGLQASEVLAQEKQSNAPPSTEHAFIRAMTGTWDVRASLWLGPNAKPIVQSAVATRRLIGQALLEEVMTPTSWDTRAPQMMYQTSRAVGMPGESKGSAVIWFYLVDNFVVPQ
jgi:hypothetical protein